MARRLTIHPPYLPNRAKGETLEDTKRTLDGMLSELHRWLRYQTDANDEVQSVVEGLTGDGPGAAVTAAEMHAHIMIRVSLDF